MGLASSNRWERRLRARGVAAAGRVRGLARWRRSILAAGRSLRGRTKAGARLWRHAHGERDNLTKAAARARVTEINRAEAASSDHPPHPRWPASGGVTRPGRFPLYPFYKTRPTRPRT